MCYRIEIQQIENFGIGFDLSKESYVHMIAQIEKQTFQFAMIQILIK